MFIVNKNMHLLGDRVKRLWKLQQVVAAKSIHLCSVIVTAGIVDVAKL